MAPSSNQPKPSLYKKKPSMAFTAVGLLVAGGILGYVVHPSTTASTSLALRQHGDAYAFIDPLLAVDRSDTSTPSAQFRSLFSTVKSQIDAAKSAGTVNDASVYFINYGKNGSFAINADAAYSPASLLKVVIMVAYLKEADSNPSIIDSRLMYTPAIAGSETIPFESPTTLEVGKSYSVESLIENMIINSDNGAMDVLADNIDHTYLDGVFTDLGIANPDSNQANYTISTKEYSLFFRVLYNSTYLSRANSEKALSILSKATYKDGLVAGLPAGTVVSHKFGEHVVQDSTGAQQSVELHDCGIVYGEGGPYLLCVMTKADTLNDAQSLIANISRVVHQAVTAQ